MCLHAQQPIPGEPAGQSSGAVQEAASEPTASAQTPGEIYKAAMHPLEVVRGSLDNWSDAELGALAVGMRKAHDACEAGRVEEYAGDDLYDFARLCALGQDWTNANAAALAYVARKLEKHRTQAYALSVNALVHMDAVDLADETTLEMLRLLPYDAEVAYAVRYMKDELDMRSSPKALELASEEHAAIVGALSQRVPLKAAQGDAVMSVGGLFESAMDLAFWQYYAGDTQSATVTVAEIDHALGTTSGLSAEDASRIAAVRLRYGLLGEHLPALSPTRSLESATAKPTLPIGDGTSAVLVFFPDWCGGCRKMMKPLTEFAKVNKTTPIRAFGLVFEDDSVIPEQAGHELLLKELKGTSTLVVPPTTVQALGADDFPLGIVLDGHGTVRFIGVLPVNAFNGDGYMEKTIVKVIAKGKSVETGNNAPAKR
jgi:thiol-disulfide isomerase/thioredoxin